MFAPGPRLPISLNQLHLPGPAADSLFVLLAPAALMMLGASCLHPPERRSQRVRLELESLLFPSKARRREALGLLTSPRDLYLRRHFICQPCLSSRRDNYNLLRQRKEVKFPLTSCSSKRCPCIFFFSSAPPPPPQNPEACALRLQISFHHVAQLSRAL